MTDNSKAVLIELKNNSNEFDIFEFYGGESLKGKYEKEDVRMRTTHSAQGVANCSQCRFTVSSCTLMNTAAGVPSAGQRNADSPSQMAERQQLPQAKHSLESSFTKAEGLLPLTCLLYLHVLSLCCFQYRHLMTNLTVEL